MNVTQREALRQAFTTLCRQYQQMGEQLKIVSAIVSPYLNGDQELSPEIDVEPLIREVLSFQPPSGPKAPPPKKPA